MNDRDTFLVIGLPSAGKTTFLAALWHVAETADVPGALSIDRLSTDREYLNRIRSAWLSFMPAARTPASSNELLELQLRVQDRDSASTLIVPDLAGETFRNQWQHREWTLRYATLATHARGAILFLNPEQHVEPTTIFETSASYRAAFGDAPPIEADLEPWDPALSPTQVQLVDILQFLLHDGHAPLHSLAVIVSAWDIVAASGLTPEEWMRQRAPLLWQFCKARFGSQLKFFGVSAQGGALDDQDDVVRLQALDNPSVRITVHSDTGLSHDISLPIRWLLESTRGAHE